MDGKKKLKLNMDELCSAMEDNSYEHEYYLDLETGEILFMSKYADTEDEKSNRNGIEDEYNRYEQVPKIESYEGYQDMQDFISTVDDKQLARLLEVAIDGKGAFRRFKDVLLEYPEERERWFTFKEERIRKRAYEWLDDIGVTLSEE